MDGKTFVGLCDQLLIEAVLAYSRLVTSDQQNCLSPRIESKSHSPDLARCIKSKLLHVGMLRSLQRVHIGASEQRPVLCKNRGGRQQFVLNPLLEGQKLLFEFIFKTDDPGIYIAHKLYSPETIRCQCVLSFGRKPPAIPGSCRPTFRNGLGRSDRRRGACRRAPRELGL